MVLQYLIVKNSYYTKLRIFFSMSHFSFNPFLLCHPNIQTQSGSNLQSFYWLAQNDNYFSNFPSPFSQNTNLFFVPDSNSILTPNFSLNVFGQYLPENQLITFPQISNEKMAQLSMMKNELSQEKNSERQNLKQEDVKFLKEESLQRNIKKKRVKKLTKKEKKQKQIQRNSVQNSKRNIIPNQIHQILSILFKRGKSTHLVEKMISRYELNNSKVHLSANRFYLYQSLLKQKINHYANENSLRHLLAPLDEECEIYSREEQYLYMRIGLTLVFHFIRNEASILILNSHRIKSSNRLEHMRIKRYLQEFLKQIIRNMKNKSNSL